MSTSALHHTIKTLRTLLTTYDVKTVDAKTLALDPWQKGAALVVIPGGRDLPYVSEMARPYSRSTDGSNGTNASSSSSSSTSSSRTASSQIREYVDSGGNFLGICAGAYYASSHCTFEKGTRWRWTASDRFFASSLERAKDGLSWLRVRVGQGSTDCRYRTHVIAR